LSSQLVVPNPDPQSIAVRKSAASAKSTAFLFPCSTIFIHLQPFVLSFYVKKGMSKPFSFRLFYQYLRL